MVIKPVTFQKSEIKDAIIVEGNQVGSTNKWAAFNHEGKIVFVYLGDLTDDHITQQRPEEAKIVGIGENGMPLISSDGEISMLGNLTPMTPSRK